MIDDLKQKLKELDSYFPNGSNGWDVGFVDSLPDKLLFIWNYKCGAEGQTASFCLSLDNYESGSFPSKCWITAPPPLKEVGGQAPKAHDEYKNFNHEEQAFFAYSVNLEGYKPTDAKSVHELIQNLYKHIKF